MPQHCWAVSRRFDHVDDLVWHGMMDHVSDILNQPEGAVCNVLIEPDGVFAMIDDAILLAAIIATGMRSFR
jgi:hypothetical protein